MCLRARLLEFGSAQGHGQPGLSRGGRRLRCAGISGQPQHLHSGKIRRTFRTHSAGGGCSALGSRQLGLHRTRTLPQASCVRPSLGNRGALRSARRAGLFHGRRHRDVLLDGLARALQFRSHGRAPDWSQARLGEERRRRGGPSSFQHSRQRLCGRNHRLYRRHARDPRARRPQPGRLCVPGNHCSRRALEDRPIEAGRLRALRADLSERCRRHGEKPGSRYSRTLR